MNENLEDEILKCIESGEHVEVVEEEVDDSTKMPYELFPPIGFPLEVYPKEYGRLIWSVSESFSVPDLAVASAVMTILSGAIGNSVRVCVKDDWKEPVQLWTMICGHSGSGKTPFINKLLEPVKSIEKKNYEQYQHDLKSYEMLKKEFDKKKSGVTPLDPPEMEHVYITDTTPEGLCKAMSTSPKGIIMFTDELSGLIKGCGQYKGGGNDKQKFLELWNGDPIKIQRATKPIVYVQDTGCAILGGIQPLALPDVFKADSFVDGLIFRFLISDISENLNRFSEISVPLELLEFWKSEIDRIYNHKRSLVEGGAVGTDLIRFNSGAQDLYKEFHDWYKQKELNLPVMAKGFIPKLNRYCVRIAGVLAVMHRVNEVDVSILKKAIDITNYYAGEAMQLLGYYNQALKPFTQQEIEVFKTMYQSKDLLKNGKIKIAKVRDLYNVSKNSYEKISSEKVTAILKKMGFSTIKTGGYSHLIYEHDLSESIYLKIIELQPIGPLQPLHK